MADGTTKWISAVQVGDQVLSRDPQTGKDEAKTVTFTIERHAPSVVDVTLHDARTGKVETLTCTPEHPLFVQGQGWVEAGSLGIGTSIVTRAGPQMSVTQVTWKRDTTEQLVAHSGLGSTTVYNLTIADDHTFFVGISGGGTWVHNIICYRQASGTPDSMTPRASDEDGLSAWDQPEQAGGPGEKIQAIDTDGFRNLTEGEMRADGHYSINPVNPSEMADWMASRGSGNIHPLTQELLDNSSYWGKLPK